MGKYVPWEKQLKRRNEWRNKHEEKRKNYKKSAEDLGNRMISQVRRLLKNCGLDQIQISDFSGLGPSSVSRFMNQRNSPKIQFTSIIALLHAAGYRVRFEKMTSEQDEFYDERRLPPGTDY